MSAEEMHPTPLSDTNGVIERSEAGEDVQTESSEGSNAQSQWTLDAGESEDEFEDAMEPSPSTSGMLFPFDGAVAPLSGVYEDAVEATDEQVLAAVVSDRRQSMIQEEKEEEQQEEKKNGVEDEVVAVVDGIVERIAAVKYEGIDKVDVFVEELAVVQGETIAEKVLIGEENTVKEDVAEEDVATGGQAVEDAEIAEADIDNEVSAGKQEVVPVDDELSGKSALEDNVEEEAAEIVSEPGTHCVDTTEDTTSVVAKAVVPTSDSVDSIVTDPVSDVDPVTEQPILDNEALKDSLEKSIDQGATNETTRLKVMILVEDTANEAVGVSSVEGDTKCAQEEEIVDENTSTEQEPSDLSVEVPCEPSTVEESPTHNIEGEVEEVVAQVMEELVEAVLVEHDKSDHADEEDLEEKPALDLITKEVATGETTPDSGHDIALQEGSQDNNVQAKDGNQTPASAVKEVTDSYRKSSYDYPNSGVLLGLLPRLEPTSGATTTTTIEPFVLSSESNEMMHLPPQRWTYEVYGFSIEDRVVYYHIHRSDRRTGIREPPVLKRYTDFRELQIQLFDTRLHAATDMPRIPRPHLGTIFRGYKSKKTIEIREKAFRALLQYISQYPALHGSSIFERFITTTRASTGAGWM